MRDYETYTLLNRHSVSMIIAVHILTDPITDSIIKIIKYYY